MGQAASTCGPDEIPASSDTCSVLAPGAEQCWNALHDHTMMGTVTKELQRMAVIGVHGWSVQDSAHVQTSERYVQMTTNAAKYFFVDAMCKSSGLPPEHAEMCAPCIYPLPVSGCTDLATGKRNDQTIMQRVDSCMEELLLGVELCAEDLVDINSLPFNPSTLEHALAIQKGYTDSVTRFAEQHPLNKEREAAAPSGEVTSDEQVLEHAIGLLKRPRIRLREMDVVFVAAHSQGSPVSVLLLCRLLRAGLIDPKSQRIVLLTMAGIHHGSIEANASISPRPATRELALMANPSYPVFRDHYLPALMLLLQSNVQVIACASFRDRVVSPASALIDGIDHVNLTRAVYVHDNLRRGRFANSAVLDLTTPCTGLTAAEVAREILLELVLIGAHLRNEGMFVDFIRFCINPFDTSISGGVANSVGEVLGVARKMYESSSASTSGWGMLKSVLATGVESYCSDTLHHTRSTIAEKTLHSDITATYHTYWIAMLVCVHRWNFGRSSQEQARMHVTFDCPIAPETAPQIKSVIEDVLKVPSPGAQRLMRLARGVQRLEKGTAGEDKVVLEELRKMVHPALVDALISVNV